MLLETLKSSLELSDESLVTAEVITKEALDVELGNGVLGGVGLELLDHGVVDLEGLAGIINTLVVAEPGGGNKSKAAERTTSYNLLGNAGHDELGDLATAAKADTGKLVLEGGVGEAAKERVAVVVDADTGDLGKERLDLLVHHVDDKLSVDGVANDFVDVVEAGELTSVAHGGVGSVEQTELDHLVLLDLVDVGDNLNTGLLKGRAAVNKLVLEHPLVEGLGDDWPGILDTKVLGKVGLVLFVGAGSDAVDHGVGESTVAGDPVGDLWVEVAGERHKHVTANVTVLLHVVAGQNGKGSQTSCVAASHGGVEVTKDGAWGLSTSQVGGNVGVVGLELVCVLVHVVTALGDSHGDNVRVGVGHLGNDGLGVVRSKEIVRDATHDAGAAALGGALNDGVEIVLGLQGIAHGGSKGLQVNTADGPILDIELLEKGVDVSSKMGAVETSHADVDNALLDPLSLVGGHRDILQPSKVFSVKFNGGGRDAARLGRDRGGDLLLLAVGEFPGRSVVDGLALRGRLTDSLSALEADRRGAVAGPGGLEDSAGAGCSQQVPGDLGRHCVLCVYV